MKQNTILTLKPLICIFTFCFFIYPTSIFADGIRHIIDKLGNQFYSHFTIENYSHSFLLESATLPDNWKYQSIEENIECLTTQLHSRWKIFKDPLLANVFRIQEVNTADVTTNLLDEETYSFQYNGTVDGLRSAVARLEPLIEPAGIIDSGSIHVERGKIRVDDEGIHINYNSIPVSFAVEKSSIRDLLTSHLPLDQFGPILWVATLYQKGGESGCVLYYGTFPLNKSPHHNKSGKPSN